MSLTGQVFEKLLTVEGVLIQMNQRVCFCKIFGSERVNESQNLVKYAEKYFYPTFSSFWAKLCYFFLITSQSLGLLYKTLTANYEYSRSNRENLPFPIHIKLYK